MKKLLIGLLAIISFNYSNAQDIDGSWLGTLSIGAVNLRVVFNISKTTDTSYTATFDSPDQKVFGLACSKTYRVKDSVFIQIAMIHAAYKGLWNEKGSINGVYNQGQAHIPIPLKHITADEKEALSKDKVRPQTPKPPFNYYSENVEYDNADKSLHYGATFTRPNGTGKYPAVIIISGSGTQDRDGSMFNGHKFYWVLADYLSRNGIAVLRVDDRGAGKSSLGNNINKATSLDFSYDVETSLNYLETRNDVDKKHIGLIGHSEGGMIAPMVAARRKDVSFIVLWAGPGIDGARILARQAYLSLKNAGFGNEATNAFNVLNGQIMAEIGSAADQQSLDTMIARSFKKWKAIQPENVLTKLQVNGDNFLGRNIFVNYNAIFNTPWLRYFISYNPAINLSKVKCPVLAVNGSKDTQVNAEENLSAIKAILTKSGNKDFETIEIPNLNHLFQDAQTGDESEYEKIDETISPVALNIICSWIKLHTK